VVVVVVVVVVTVVVVTVVVVTVKVKFTLEQATKTQKGSRSITLFFL
jgi:hypothetical protein